MALDNTSAARALGIGVALWTPGFLVLVLGGPLAVIWLPFMVAAAAAGTLAIGRAWRTKTLTAAVLLPLGILLVGFSALGLLAPFAM